MQEISLKSKVGGGYKEFWNSKHRYRIVKGSRRSKKSKTTALWYIYHMMKHPKANLLVVRQVFNTHKDSTYTELKWAINHLGVDHLWKCTVNPLRITYIPGGNTILFRGLDDALSITSISVEHGHLCWIWVEEAFQIKSLEAFNKLNESTGAKLPDGLWHQTTMTFNPWSTKTWLYTEFWERYQQGDPLVLFMTTNYLQNEWLDDSYKRDMEWMRDHNPRRYRVAGLGEWGIEDGQIFENWKEEEFDYKNLIDKKDAGDRLIYKPLYGLDFGFAHDPTAFVAMLVDKKNRKLYIYDEFYEYQLDQSGTVELLTKKGFNKVRIMCDNNPSTVFELKKLGLNKLKIAKKGPGSIEAGIRRLQDYEIIVHPKCENTIIELSNYVWEKKDDEMTNKPIDEFNHIIDAMRYATEGLGTAEFEFR